MSTDHVCCGCHESEIWQSAWDEGWQQGYEANAVRRKQLEELLYLSTVELQYVQSVENCSSGLCASAKGRDLVEQGMRLLNVMDLSKESLRP